MKNVFNGYCFSGFYEILVCSQIRELVKNLSREEIVIRQINCWQESEIPKKKKKTKQNYKTQSGCMSNV